MKKIIMSLFIFSLNFNLLAQEGDPIKDLFSNDDLIVWEALEEIENLNITEAIPVLIDLISAKHPVTQLRFLEVLKYLKYDQLRSAAYEFIHRSDTFNDFDPPYDPLKAKVKVTLLLFYLGDFNTYNYVFDYISEIKPNVADEAIYLLPLISEYVPSHSNQAYIELLYAYINSEENSVIKYFCLENLNKMNPANFNADLITQFTQSPVYENRIQALELLCQNRIPGLNQILINQLDNESSPTIRIKIVDSLLVLYGTPFELHTIKNYLTRETDNTNHTIISYEVANFIPPRPTVTTEEMIENLITYNDELLQYGWITEYPVYNSYKKILEKTQESYRSQSLPDLCENLNSLLQLAENQHGGPLLTEEGYKFLHYHGTYIKENVESEFGTCEEREK